MIEGKFIMFDFTTGDLVCPSIIVAGMIYSLLTKKLTVPASFTGGLLACVICIGAGFCGLMMMTVFFITGSAATSWRAEVKRKILDADDNRAGRTAAQVFANAGVSGLAAALIIFDPQLSGLLLPVMAAGFASATADTLSSELGMIYGRRFFNVITLKSEECGQDGAISLAGTLIGLMGSCLIALVHGIGFGFGADFLWIVLAGTAGNYVDSLLGALLERKGLIVNNTVNFFNTLSAALVMLALSALF